MCQASWLFLSAHPRFIKSLEEPASYESVSRGEKRTREIMPVRAWLEEGASLSVGTNHPVSSFNPLLVLWGMVTRGTLKAGVQGPEYAIDQYTAVQLYTAVGAQLNGESHQRGTLNPRRLADLVVFRSNPIKCPIDDLPSLRPVFTMVAGRVVYDPEAMASREFCARAAASQHCFPSGRDLPGCTFTYPALSLAHHSSKNATVPRVGMSA